MMRVSKALGSFAAAALVIAGVTTSSGSRASGDEALLDVSCTNGNVTVTAKSPWHTNKEAPWKWDKGDKVEVNEHHAKFHGAACTGTVKAFICNGDQCKGPIKVGVH
jgi:predicted dehydrogenase